MVNSTAMISDLDRGMKMSNVKRIYVEKRLAYATEANETKQNLSQQLNININSLRIINRYDIQGISDDVLNQGINTILAEPMVDDVYQESFPVSNQESVFAIEYLPEIGRAHV